jgi:hypothetical protein
MGALALPRALFLSAHPLVLPAICFRPCAACSRPLSSNITRWTDVAITSANPGMSWHLTLSTYCAKEDRPGWSVAPSSLPAYPLSTYASSRVAANVDLAANAIGDNAFSMTVVPLPNVKLLSLSAASMINAVGAAIAPTTNSVALTVLEIGSKGYTNGDQFDLTQPNTLQAWPMVAMTSVRGDEGETAGRNMRQARRLSTCNRASSVGCDMHCIAVY